ncbi:PilW family protein [Desulfotruncus alcoholivorax]|uniref:PilW family protein n=1 Tax=Desulfotruncus alcoholivorax TaxID=265477 RepID=UPI0004294785|nr:prepilin-type N-terminal cleavage/methylation domain-containing protein [Desulfotruncus alcoholivorax]
MPVMPVYERQRQNGGFTLVEMLIALALLSTIIVVSNNFFLSGLASWQRNLDKAEVEENLRIAVDRLSRELRRARCIIVYERNELYPKGKISFQIIENGALKTISYYCSPAGDNEKAMEIKRRKTGFIMAYPVARYIINLDVKPEDCGPQTALATITLTGEKRRSGEIKVSTTVLLRNQD